MVSSHPVADPSPPASFPTALRKHLRAIKEIEDRFAAGDLFDEAVVRLGELGHEILNEMQILQLHANMRGIYVSPITRPSFGPALF